MFALSKPEPLSRDDQAIALLAQDQSAHFSCLQAGSISVLFDFLMSLFSEFEVTDTYVTKQLCSSNVSIHLLETAFQSLDGMTVEVSSNFSPFEIKAPAVT